MALTIARCSPAEIGISLRVGQVQAPEQRQLLDQLAVDRGQLAVAAELDQAVVELAG